MLFYENLRDISKRQHRLLMRRKVKRGVYVNPLGER
jgi:hypothetical protein